MLNFVFVCRSGIYETGMLVGCLRKLERWTLSSILAEVGSTTVGLRRAGPVTASHRLSMTDWIRVTPVR